MNDIYTAIIITLVIVGIAFVIGILFIVGNLIDYLICMTITKIEKKQKGVKHNA